MSFIRLLLKSIFNYSWRKKSIFYKYVKSDGRNGENFMISLKTLLFIAQDIETENEVEVLSLIKFGFRCVFRI